MTLSLLGFSAMLMAGLAVPPTPVPNDATVVGADQNGNALKVFDVAGGVPYNLTPYSAGFLGGVRVAVGDVNGDGVADLITAPGSGIPRVRVLNGRNGNSLRSFDAYAASFTLGVYVGAGDVTGDGFADIITGSGAGSVPHVKVFDGRTGVELRSFLPYGDSFTGGVSVAAGDLDGDGRDDIITGSATLSSHVKVFSGVNNSEMRSFLAFGSFTGGVFVAGGDWNGDGRDDLVAGTASTTSHVKVFNATTGAELASFFAFTPGTTDGVRVATVDIDHDGDDDLLTGAGSGSTPTVARFRAPTLSSDGSFLAFDAGYDGGVFVAGAAPPAKVFSNGFETP